jgi:hypothetical protein
MYFSDTILWNISAMIKMLAEAENIKFPHILRNRAIPQFLQHAPSDIILEEVCRESERKTLHT